MRKLFNFGLPILGFMGLILALSANLLVFAYGAWTDTINFSGTVTTAGMDQGGTPGFWKNWDSHSKFTQSQILEFLFRIDVSSSWLLPDLNKNNYVDINDMEMVFDAGERSGTMEEKFLRSYLATRLNAESDRLLYEPIRNFFQYDPDDYLDLGGTGTLWQIIEAIESKYGISPTEEEYELMKDICDALNNVDISFDYGWKISREEKPLKTAKPAK